jgi:hypothetical protein
LADLTQTLHELEKGSELLQALKQKLPIPNEISGPIEKAKKELEIEEARRIAEIERRRRSPEGQIEMISHGEPYLSVPAAKTVAEIGNATHIQSLLAAIKSNYTKGFSSVGDAAMEALLQILERDISRATEKDLLALAHLKIEEVSRTYSDKFDDDRFATMPEEDTRPVDCSKVITIAQREIQRRGLVLQ